MRGGNLDHSNIPGELALSHAPQFPHALNKVGCMGPRKSWYNVHEYLGSAEAQPKTPPNQVYA